jgi:dienelactone hydrolase
MLCGGDQNPRPRGTLDLAKRHGRDLAGEVERVLAGVLRPIAPSIRTAVEVVPLAFAPHTRATFEEEAKSGDVYRQRRARLMLAAWDEGRPVRETPYPVQTVRLGRDLTLVALGGEPVVDYALRAKRELAGEDVIVAGYVHDVMGYIPSRRVLREGGYEAVDSTIYYGLPGPFTDDVENTVFGAVRRVAAAVGATPMRLEERAAEAPPPVDRRSALVRTLDTPHVFAPPADAEAWRARARELREQVLVSAGLWPMPERGPLRAQVFGRIERGDYSVEKVHFESHPGFLVTGNLYRPLGKTGPFPAVLSPHGHWAYGRLENGADGSIPARCISLARQGHVVFSYDMVGYNDSRQVDHRLMDPRLAQWGIGSLGLHLWNSIRALDFLESLPDVDRERLACTGASGGGTQTFLLSAVDDRVKVTAPVNMISHFMQGGDVCENAPNLRLDTDNVEIAALAAPRPMLMVSAAGDWTRDTPRVEFPAVRAVYELLDAAGKVATVQMIADHNYNQASREAVYGWFSRWLLGRPDASPVAERESTAEQPADLLVFHGRGLPEGARTQAQIVERLVEARRAHLAALRPRDAAGLARFREVLGPGLRHALAAERPPAEDLLESPSRSGVLAGVRDLAVGRRGRGDRVPLRLWAPPPESRRAVLVVHPEGLEAVTAREGSLVDPLRRQGWLVASIDAFNTGSARAWRDTSDRFFTTYNRTDDALRVQDVLTALAWLKTRPGVRSVSLVGLDRAGLWCLLAQALAPDLDAVVADAAGFASESDASYLGPISIPLLRSVGGFETALTLGLGSRLLVHGTAGAFDTTAAEASARAASGRLEARRETLPDAGVVAWLGRDSR